jgi:iron(III) transport system substrate-binding protein
MRYAAALVLLLLLASCAPAAPAPTPAPAQPGAAPSAATGWDAQWNDLIAAARQEGSVVVAGPPTAETRTAVPAAFRRRFGIDLEYFSPGDTASLLTRLEAERSAGQYTVDVIVGGANSIYTIAYPAKMLDPVKPHLIHPEVTDPAKWVSGKPWFMDPEQQSVLRISNSVTNHIVVNTDYVALDEIKSYQDLLKPQFKGKVSAYDLTNPARGWHVPYYLMTVLGPDFVEGLFVAQQPGISRDFRQLADWIARGQYPVSLGVRAADLDQLKADGFKLAVVAPPQDAPVPVGAGFGLAVLLNQAPHPNAAKLFLNWIASKEGQEVWHEAEKTVSVRTDVDNRWAAPHEVPPAGRQWFDTNEWDYVLAGRSPEILDEFKRRTGAQ